MGQPATILNAAEQQRFAIFQANRRRVEDAVDGVGPVSPAEQGIS
jgi:hypothetical protein